MKHFAPVSLMIIAMLFGCALVLPKETRYLRSAEGRAGQDEVVQNLGMPLMKSIDPDGKETWVYQFREQDPGMRWTSTGLWCDEYVLTFDDHSILRRWTHKSQFHGGELMPTHCVPGGVMEAITATSNTELH
jgi:outer membrane protein assembly factor BamE (lipoprotein component of BamABCDE complex)